MKFVFSTMYRVTQKDFYAHKNKRETQAAIFASFISTHFGPFIFGIKTLDS
jgi:hypothetical protein